MPAYEYKCKDCGETIEIVQSFTDPPLSACTSCESPNLKKVFGSVGIVFKGSGFYKTDSRDKKSASASNAVATKEPGSKDLGSTEPGSKDPGSKERSAKNGDLSTSNKPGDPGKSDSAKTDTVKKADSSKSEAKIASGVGSNSQKQ